MIKKIPHIALVNLNAKGDYKSLDSIKFTAAYMKSFSMVKRTLNHFNQPIPTNDSFEGFTSLYFPPEKVIESANNKDLANKLTSMKRFTSIKQIQELSAINPWFLCFLDFAILVSKIQDSQTHLVMVNLRKALI